MYIQSGFNVFTGYKWHGSSAFFFFFSLSRLLFSFVGEFTSILQYYVQLQDYDQYLVDVKYKQLYSATEQYTAFLTISHVVNK